MSLFFIYHRGEKMNNGCVFEKLIIETEDGKNLKVRGLLYPYCEGENLYVILVNKRALITWVQRYFLTPILADSKSIFEVLKFTDESYEVVLLTGKSTLDNKEVTIAVPAGELFTSVGRLIQKLVPDLEVNND